MADDKQAIFEEMKSLLTKQARGMDVRKDDDANYELYGKKTVEVKGKKNEGMYFASIVKRKSAVSFYFFPVYTHPKEIGAVPQPLGKCMSGKSCFQIKKDDKEIYGQVKDLLKAGKKHYKDIGWV